MNRFGMRLLTAATALVIALLGPGASAATPEVQLAQEPLYSGQANVHPNLLLSLSVEFPTAGIAYRGDNGTYNRTREYLGYFDPSKCYVYQGGNRNLTDDAYFVVHKPAQVLTRECGGDSFSGNFMNWASTSAIDILRYALTGGDRIIDTPQLTVLQRAVLHDTASVNFYAHRAYFPRRSVSAGGSSSAPGQVTPFNVRTLHVVSCRNRILFSNLSSGLHGDANSALAGDYCRSHYDGHDSPPTTAQDKRLGEYLVRVRVCDQDEGPARPDLCMKYGEHYKPVGELQRRAGVVRVGAMGYLLDDAPERYGGVLRAPLKYLGAKRFEAPQFSSIANDRPEWDALTGVFYSNPENPAERNGDANSGVINYLNKFGRSARYKTHDPVGELYYEGLRYLQGKQPTPAAVSGLNATMYDGFPVLEQWTDPVVASCQRNYILAIADVNTHWDRFIPGNDRTTYSGNRSAYDSMRAVEPRVAGRSPEFDVRIWTQKVGEMEADSANTYANPEPNSSLVDLHVKDTGAAGHGTYYVAGLAYWANTNDIRLDKPVRVKTFAIDVDEGGNGLIDGNSRALKPRISQLYLAAKYGGFNDRNADGIPYITTAPDAKSIVRGSNVEWDNGAGVPANYFLGGQPNEMLQAVRRVFANIGAASGSLSAVSVSSKKLSSEGVYVYQPGFDPSSWSGNLFKRALLINDAQKVSIATTAEWDAGNILTGSAQRAPNPLPSQRRIYTTTPQNGMPVTVEFKWDSLSRDQQELLHRSPVNGSVDDLGKLRLAYLRGERGNELGKPNGIFRRRNSVLGDIVNSNPVYVGGPAQNGGGTAYAAFVEKHRRRSPVVYVGANDGMLHAFNAQNGAEMFAYVPTAVMRNLPHLTDPNYAHRPYVDGGLAAAEARVRGQWRTVLGGATGGGAQAVFALDVSDPTAFGGKESVLFEFSDLDDPDLGNVLGEPSIAKFRTGTKGGFPQYAYFLVVASGINNYHPDGEERFNNDAASALFLLSLDKHSSADWALGTNYFKFRLPATTNTRQNGLAQPALVLGADGAVRFAYAGDLQGNLWRLDFTGPRPWTQSVAGNSPVFVALDPHGVRQPITSRPHIVFAQGGYVVSFGTGKFLEHADVAPATFSTQSFYGLYDTTHAGYRVAGREDLIARTLVPAADGGYFIAGEPVQFSDQAGGYKGWYMDLPDSASEGERVIAQGTVLNGTLYFNSVIPGTDPCAQGGGRTYVLNTLSGLTKLRQNTGYLSHVGMLSAPLVLESGAAVGKRDAVGRRLVERRENVVTFGTGGAKGTAAPAENGSSTSTVRAGRLSWREIANLQELRNENK